MLIDENATAALHGLTLTGGRTSDGDDGGFDENGGVSEGGGGIFVASSSLLTLDACTISDNQTGRGDNGGSGGFGGGIFVASNGSLTLSVMHHQRTIKPATAADGGFGRGSVEDFEDIGGERRLRRHAADDGGGIALSLPAASLTLIACSISDNQASGNGIGDGGRAVFDGFGGFGG